MGQMLVWAGSRDGLGWVRGWFGLGLEVPGLLGSQLEMDSWDRSGVPGLSGSQLGMDSWDRSGVTGLSGSQLLDPGLVGFPVPGLSGSQLGMDS